MKTTEETRTLIAALRGAAANARTYERRARDKGRGIEAAEVRVRELEATVEKLREIVARAWDEGYRASVANQQDHVEWMNEIIDKDVLNARFRSNPYRAAEIREERDSARHVMSRWKSADREGRNNGRSAFG